MLRALLLQLITFALFQCADTVFVSDWKELKIIVDYIPSTDLDIMDEWDRVDQETRALSEKEVGKLKKTLEKEFPNEMRIIENVKGAKSLSEARTVLDAFSQMKPSIEKELESIKEDRNKKNPDLWTMIIRGVVSLVA